jgi:hypothetical protein
MYSLRLFTFSIGSKSNYSIKSSLYLTYCCKLCRVPWRQRQRPSRRCVMEHTASRTMTAERIPAGRLLRVGVLAAVFSAIANALVLALASSLFGPVVIPPDEAVTFGQVTAASVAGAVGAAAIFASSAGSPGARSAPSGASQPSVCFSRFFRSPWRAPRDHLQGRWLLCTCWPRPPTLFCSRDRVGRSKA